MFTLLPSLLGWKPPTRGLPPWHARAGCVASAGGLPRAAALSTLSDRITITPAIEAQLECIRQRHDELVKQLSGDAMSQ